MRTGKRIATLIFVSLFFTAALPLSATEKQPTIGGSYTVHDGDSLWRIAGRAYSGHADWKKVGWIVNANPGRITNPKHIEAGWTIVVPPVPTQFHHAAVPAATIKATITTAIVQTQPAPAASPRITLPATEALPEPTATLALPDSPITLPKVLYKPSPRVLLANTVGYRLPLPVQVAIASKIPLKGNFNSQVFLYESESDKSHGWFSGEMFHINTRVQYHKKGAEITLSLALKTLPSKPFIVVIAGNNVDGEDFLKQARPFTGKFPGPNGFERNLITAGRVMIPYAIASGATANPIPLFIGAGHVIIPAVTSALLHHSADRIEAKAEAKLQKALADNKKLLDVPLPVKTPDVTIASATTQTQIERGLE
jgi:hypothetical protein